ncbi:hypothetical protein BGW39_008410 [Mortierella sp. 14UC]|nr:hypothetical protein BGW39_008410 [Mortierella sp. 14UC]
MLRTSHTLGRRIRTLALTRTPSSAHQHPVTTASGTRFASSLDTPIRATHPTSRAPASAAARRTNQNPRKEFIPAFVGGSSIDDNTPPSTSSTTSSHPSRSSSPPRRYTPTRTIATPQSATTLYGLPNEHLLITKDFVKFVQKKRTPQQILEHVMEARYQRDRDFMLSRILNEYLKLGQVHNIEPLIIEMEKNGLSVKSETYTVLLRGLATFAFSSSHTTAAQSLYSRLKSQYDHPPTIDQANSMLRIYQRLGITGNNYIEGMEQVYGDMAKRGPDAPTVVTYGTLIKAYGRIGGDRAFERAWRVWVEYLNTTSIRREGGELIDTGMLGAILAACKEATNPDYMRRGYRLFESYYGIKAGLATPLGAATFTAGTPAGAGGYGHVRVQGGPHKTSSAALDQSASTKGLTLGAASESVKVADPRPEMLELVMMISSQLGDFDRGIRYMDFIRETYPEYEPSSRNLATYMRLQTSAKDYEGAFRTWDEMKRLGQEHTRASWKQALQAAGEANNWERVYAMYKEQLAASRKSRDSAGAGGERIPQDAWTLASTLRVAVRTNHLAEGFDILQESQWQNVVCNREFPRANLDIARAAVKIYGGLKFGIATTTTTSTDGTASHSDINSGAEDWSNDLLEEEDDKRSNGSGSGKEEDKIIKGVNLTQELKAALKIRMQLERALADYHADGGRAYKKRAVSHGDEPFFVGDYGAASSRGSSSKHK